MSKTKSLKLGYHLCAFHGCKTQMSAGSPDLCPAHQSKPRTVRPLGDRIIVKPFDTARSAVIHIPENAKGTPTRGIVLAVGTSVKEDIRVGQEVLVTTMGSDFDFGHGLVKVFDMHQVLAIIN